ncbi:MAG: hypothetical protein F4017_08755 [Acidimicrobiaceae bacterium]|nr:hypothetical protein [Acidimicrobiaceae bacterium]MYE76433.1 hypothetical protein [Acidimicrobiaceae bacterium]MYH42305.1 hypothetical protein [Acidimicrobiaceae bacterium]MYJ42380.1 hypothetical protein [Acidimicrobiaceae bacterium]MYJ81030.1 hypothetical protein [Acidimicrobiaceae bacterium]
MIGAFLTGLRDNVIGGIRRADGTVLCPPQEHDPLTAEPLTELVEVGQAGEVLTWSWNGDPRPMQPFDRPFAWALIRRAGRPPASPTRSSPTTSGSAASRRATHDRRSRATAGGDDSMIDLAVVASTQRREASISANPRWSAWSR